MQYAHKMKSHRPKGSMCVECINKTQNCSDYDFTKMKSIGKDSDGIVIVKCSEYEKDPFLEYLETLPKVQP